jgi:hypothetical protein
MKQRIASFHWKTSILGIATAFFAFVMFSPQYFAPVIVDLAKFATIGGLAGLGIAAADSSKAKKTSK